MDYEDIENKIKDVKLFIFCNFYNLVGRVWIKDELKKLGDICFKYNVKIIFDEIYSDIILKKYKYIFMVFIFKEFEKNIIICMVLIKIFNIVGF